MLMRWDPFRDIDRVAASLLGDEPSSRTMAMDAYRQGDELRIDLDLPGIDPESIELTVERNVLSISARRSVDRSGVDQLIVSERPQGVFTRQVFLGDSLDADALEAAYDHGVLSIKVPVLESAKPRRIPVTVDSGERAAIEAG
ncbi:Hsp20/alpha crystallin family protein [Nitriliruptor alkaliphilus]|uniref:Hsp20/alpha crystallin family protein n=1 Tax=Nitriliruptor alkaliphilus TaxID=427918 RepID=UPI0006973421|nr:Hsp20/alpha crystallin family protein [Nitriliruptor alkaliphilus]